MKDVVERPHFGALVPALAWLREFGEAFTRAAITPEQAEMAAGYVAFVRDLSETVGQPVGEAST